MGATFFADSMQYDILIRRFVFLLIRLDTTLLPYPSGKIRLDYVGTFVYKMPTQVTFTKVGCHSKKILQIDHRAIFNRKNTSHCSFLIVKRNYIICNESFMLLIYLF